MSSARPLSSGSPHSTSFAERRGSVILLAILLVVVLVVFPVLVLAVGLVSAPRHASPPP
jgi:hypothetical protein